MSSDARYVMVGMEAEGVKFSASCTLRKYDRTPGLTTLKFTFPAEFPFDHFEIDYHEVVLALGKPIE